MRLRATFIYAGDEKLLVLELAQSAGKLSRILGSYAVYEPSF
jgi:hypothetical protein